MYRSKKCRLPKRVWVPAGGAGGGEGPWTPGLQGGWCSHCGGAGAGACAARQTRQPEPCPASQRPHRHGLRAHGRAAALGMSHRKAWHRTRLCAETPPHRGSAQGPCTACPTPPPGAPALRGGSGAVVLLSRLDAPGRSQGEPFVGSGSQPQWGLGVSAGHRALSSKPEVRPCGPTATATNANIPPPRPETGPVHEGFLVQG